MSFARFSHDEFDFERVDDATKIGVLMIDIKRPDDSDQPSPNPETGSKDNSRHDVVSHEILAALRGLEFGEVTITVREGRVVQIERITRRRQIVPSQDPHDSR